MKVTRVDPKTGLKKKFSELEQRIANQETKPTGSSTVRDDNIIRTYDPVTGVETIIGKLPDGSYGIQPFVGDTEPPPVATAPIATEQPGTMTVYWDGAFVGGASQPRDFQHVNVNAHKVVSGAIVQTTFVGVIRLPNESVLVSTDVASVGSTWKFSFTSEDYNKNLSASSAFSPVITMQSTAIDEEVAQIIEDINAALDNTNKVWYETTAPAGTSHKKGDTWYDTDDGYKIYVWNGSQWVNSQDAAIRAAQVAATGAQATADLKNKNYYQPTKPTGGVYKNGDQWFDTDDGYKLYVYTGSDFVLFQDAAITTAQVAATGAQATADGKNKNYYQPTKPTGGVYRNGDQWFDTDDGYKLYVYTGSDFVVFQDAAIASLQDGLLATSQTATGALFVANGKNKNYVGAVAPTPSGNNVVGDLWIDTANGNKINRWSGTAWVDYRDTTIATAQNAANNALSVANGKNTSFLGGTSPTASAVGDLWLDTANGNQLKRWSGSAWVDARDAYIGVAQQAATAAQATADGKNTSYYQGTQPSGGTYKIGDLWFDTANNYKLYTYKGGGTPWQATQDSFGALTTAQSKTQTFIQGTTPSAVTVGDLWINTANNNQMLRASSVGTGGWVDARDATIALASQSASAAQSTADGKNTVFYSTTQPSTVGRKNGDTWFDTDDDNRIYIWNGAWTATQLGSNAIQDSSIINAKIANATIQAAKIGSVDAGTISVGTLSADRIGASTIGVEKLNVGSLDNLITEPTFLNGAASWANTGAFSVDATGARNGGPAWKIANAASQQGTYNRPQFQPIEGGQSYRMLAYIKSDVTIPVSGASLYITTKNAAGTQSIVKIAANTSTIAANTWTPLSGNRKTPSDAVAINFGIFTETNFSTGSLWVDFVSATRMAGGELMVDGSITAGSAIIADSAIGTAHIGTGVITNAKIKDADIQYGKIGSVDAGTISVGTLDAARIAAGSIASSKLMVTDLTNFAPSMAESPTDWTLDSPITIATTTSIAYDRKRLSFIDNTGVAKLARGPLIAVQPSDELYGEGVIFRSGATTNDISIKYYYYDNAKVYISSNSTKLDGTATPTTDANGTLHKVKSVAPPNAMYARLVVLMTNTTNNDIGMYNLRGYRRNGGELLVDGTITAGSAIIATGAIGDAQISTLSAGKVSASWLDAGEIKAGAIKTSQLAVSDQTNFAPSYAEDPTAWTFSTGMSNILTAVASYDKRRFLVTTNQSSASAQGPMLAVQELDDLYAEAKLYRTGVTTNNLYLRWQFYDANKVFLSDDGKMYDGASKGNQSTTVGNMANGTIHKITAIAPANTMYARLCLFASNATANDIGFYNVRGYRRNKGELIVDGAIVAGSAIIADAAIDGAQIKQATITAANIASVSAGSITAGTLDAARIGAGTLTADKLMVGLGNNLVGDPGFQNTAVQAARKAVSDGTAATWTVDPATQSVSMVTGPTPAQAVWRLREATSNSDNNSQPYPVQQGRKYSINFEVYRPSGTNPSIRANISYRKQDGSTPLYVTDGMANVTVPNVDAWNMVTRVWTPPADATFFGVDLSISTSLSNSGVKFRSPTVRAMSDATLIEDGAIKTQHVTTGTLDAGVISSGSIKALQIGSKEISVDKLLVTSTDNLISEADFTGQGKSWYLATDSTGATGWSINATAGRNSAPALQVANQAIQQESWNSTITGVITNVDQKARFEYAAAGKQTYRLSAWVKSTVTVPVSGARILVRYKNSANVVTFDFVHYTVAGVASTIPANTWTQIVGQLTTPDDNVSIAFGLQSATTLTSGTLYWDFVSATRASDGTLIVDGAIKANHIDVGAVNAGKIAAGAVGALEIAAKSVAADKLLISSTDNLVQEGTFAGNGLSWDLPTNVTINATAGRNSLPAMVIAQTASLVTSYNAVGTNPAARTPIEVQMSAGEAVRISSWIKASATLPVSGAMINARWKLSTGSTSVSSMPYNVVTSGVAVPSTLAANTWGEIFGIFKAPANTISVAFYITKATTYSTGTLTVDSVKVTRASNGELIVDGSITGDQIKANSVNANVLQANTITGDLIVGKTISVDKLLIASTDNLISEGDFSAGGVAWGTMGTPYFIDATGARDGTAAFKIVNSAVQHGRYNLNYIPVEAPESSTTEGASYRVSVWAKADVSVPSGAVSVYVRRKKADGTVTPVLLASNVGVQSANTWFKISGIYTIPYDAVSPVMAITIGLFKQTTLASGNTWFDSVSVTRAGDSNLILDGAMDAKTITGGTIQTSSSANRGIKLTPTALTGYDGSGNVNFSLTASTGAITITGATMKTATTGSRVEIDPTNGMRIYNSSSALLLQASGAGVTMTGELKATGFTAENPTPSPMDTYIGPVRWNSINDTTTPALYFLKQGNVINSVANPTGFFPPMVHSTDGNSLTMIGARSGSVSGSSALTLYNQDPGVGTFYATKSVELKTWFGGAISIGELSFGATSIQGNSIDITAAAGNITVNGEGFGWKKTTPTQPTYSSVYTSYSGYASPTYYRDTTNVYLGGVVGCSSTNITLVAATYYQIGTIPSGYAPQADQIFPVVVSPSMDKSTFLVVRNTGAIEYYSPTGMTLAKANFYIAISGAKWFRNA